MIDDISFGEPLNCVLEPACRSWPLMLSRVRKVTTVLSEVQSIAQSSSLLQCLLPGSILQKSVLQHVINRIASNPSRGDVFSSIICHNPKNGILDDTEIMANTSLLILAGSDKLATLLSAVTYFLTQNPGPLSILTKEMRGNFKDESPLSAQSLSHRARLVACMEEAMRLVLPLPEGLPRVTFPETEHMCGHWVPDEVSFALVLKDTP